MPSYWKEWSHFNNDINLPYSQSPQHLSRQLTMLTTSIINHSFCLSFQVTSCPCLPPCFTALTAYRSVAFQKMSGKKSGKKSEKSQEKSREKSRKKSQEKSRKKSREKSQEKSQEKGREKSREKSQEKSREKKWGRRKKVRTRAKLRRRFEVKSVISWHLIGSVVFSQTNKNKEKAWHTLLAYYLLIDIVQSVWLCALTWEWVIQLSTRR